MNENKIRKLVKIVEESNIAELEVSRWGQTIKITKTHHNNSYGGAVPVQTYAAPTVTPAPAAEASPPPEAEKREPSGQDKGNVVEIKAPMVGTFYRAPAPEAEPYVEVNQMVKKGQVLCIIEAMKLMNEIESEYDGKLVEILVENGQPVEYNQPLFRVELS